MNAAAVDVRIAPSPLLKQIKSDDDAERLAAAAALTRFVRGQVSVRANSTKHRHVGGCMSVRVERYEPGLCDCAGPADARRHLELVDLLLKQWFDADRVVRLLMIPTLEAAAASLGPKHASCRNCEGSGMAGVRLARVRCFKCNGVGTRPAETEE